MAYEELKNLYNVQYSKIVFLGGGGIFFAQNINKPLTKMSIFTISDCQRVYVQDKHFKT